MQASPTINESLREHCSSPAVDDWLDKDWARQLHVWSERMSAAFGLDIATPAISIDRPRFRGAGSYRAERNGFGLKHQLTVNRKRFGDPLAWVLAGLLPQLLREWQNLHGKPNQAAHYCNRQLREHAGRLGLELDRCGRIQKVVPGPFTQLLEEHRVDASPLAGPVPDLEPSTRKKLRKWACPCTSVWASIGVDVQARCLKCGQDYVPASGKVEVKPDDVNRATES